MVERADFNPEAFTDKRPPRWRQVDKTPDLTGPYGQILQQSVQIQEEQTRWINNRKMWIKYSQTYRPELFKQDDEQSVYIRERAPEGDPLIDAVMQLPESWITANYRRSDAWLITELARKGPYLDLDEIKRARSVAPGWARVVFNTQIRHIEQYDNEAVEHLGLPTYVIGLLKDLKAGTIPQVRQFIENLGSAHPATYRSLKDYIKEIELAAEKLDTFDRLLAAQFEDQTSEPINPPNKPFKMPFNASGL